MNTASEEKLIPAPLDEKNLTTDWIEEVFDDYRCSCGGKRNNLYTGIVEDCPVSCLITCNRVMWHVDPHIGGVPNAGHAYRSLINRIKDLFDEASFGGRTMGKYPYRIQYFVCKEFAENEKNVPGLLKALQELDSFTGEVTGETGIDGLPLRCFVRFWGNRSRYRCTLRPPNRRGRPLSH